MLERRFRGEGNSIHWGRRKFVGAFLIRSAIAERRVLYDFSKSLGFSLEGCDSH